MEIRKLQYTGKGTYVLSLPKKWLKKYNLKKGDKFAIIEMENGFFVTPKFNENKDRSATIEISKDISREIISRYTYGYKTLNITGKITSEARNDIKETISELMGYDIIDEKEDIIVIQDLLDPSQLTIKKTLKREYFLASMMHRDALIALQNNDRKMALDIIKRDSEVNKLYFLAVRQIRTALQNTVFAESSGINSLESIDIRIVSKNIEEIGDHAVVIAQSILMLTDNEKELFEDISKLGYFAYKMNEIAFKAFIESSRENANAALGMKKEFLTKKEELDKLVIPSPYAIALRNILENIKDIGEKGVDIAHLVFKPQEEL
ncbi:MAG: PhoU domain-containing protein [Candidatus Methanofastidiosia archaeon]